MINLEKKESIYFLTMDAGENRWNTTFVREFSKALDDVEKDKGPGALVTSCLLYTSPSPRDLSTSRMPSSA